MPRKVTHAVSPIGDEDDMLSQYSRATDNDDRELEVYAKAVAEFKVSWQKQKKEKQRKFLKAAQAELDNHVTQKQREIEEIMKDMEGIYQEFLAKHTVLEDKKRDVRAKTVETQRTLVALSVRKHQHNIQLTHDLEEGQVEGIRQVKQTCKDFIDTKDSSMVA